jgi:hypothetical protein
LEAMKLKRKKQETLLGNQQEELQRKGLQKSQPRQNELLIIDTDVLINLLDGFYLTNPEECRIVFKFIILSKSRCWIPATVLEEFLVLGKRRQRRIKLILNEFREITNCPIKVSKHEINSFVSAKCDRGEADAILQAQSAKSSSNYSFTEIHFLTADKGAIRRATQHGIKVYPYKDLKKEMQLMGIVLP